MEQGKKIIGVITFLETRSNYGQVLQAFALQYVLKQWGYDAYIVDFEKQRGRVWWKRLIIKVIDFFRLSHCYLALRGDTMWRHDSQRKFDEFKTKYISRTRKKYRSLYQLQKKPPYAHCYIAGSDQVWAQLISNPENRAYFLDFGDDNVCRISYAPSFAMSEYPKNLLPQLGSLLRRFDYLSVREDSSIQICKAAGCSNVQKVLDPTLLLTGDVYTHLFLSANRPVSPYIFVYSLNISDKEEMEWSALSTYAGEQGMDIKVTPSSGAYPAKELFDGVHYSYCTVEGWISNIAYSTLTVTTSFHGIVFCLLLNKNFVYIPLKNAFKRANNRVTELLDILDLNQKMVSDAWNFNQAAEIMIDWDKVNMKLEDYRKSSFTFLQKSIGVYDKEN